MRIRDDQLVTTEAELRVPTAMVQLVQFHLPEPVDDILRDREDDAHRLDLCLTPRPRNARAGYCDRWGPHRFEPIGDVFVVPPGETVRARSDGGRQVSIVCWLYSEPLRAWLDCDLEWNPRWLEATLDVRNANLRSLMLRLAEEARDPGFGGRMLVELIAGQMAIELARYCTAIAEGPVTDGLAPWRLRLIEERIREVRKPPTLAELAGLCGLSVRQLTRAFRASRGCSIGQYVARSQVDHARRLLATDQTVKAIAYSLGFCSPSKFASAFRRATGETPREFRQRALAKSPRTRRRS